MLTENQQTVQKVSKKTPTANRWAQQAPWITKERAIPNRLNECRLLIAMQGLAHNVSHICSASKATLSEITSIPISSLSVTACELERKGYIEIEAKGYDWSRRTNRKPKKHARVQYVLCWDSQRYYEYRKHAEEPKKKPGTFSGKQGKNGDTPF